MQVGFSALILMLLWRPWRWPLFRADAKSLLRYGVALGFMNLLFYMSLCTIPFGLTVAAIRVVPFGVWHAGTALLDPYILLFGLGVAAVSSSIPISLEMVAQARGLKST